MQKVDVKPGASGVLSDRDRRLLSYLQEFLTRERRARFEEVLALRTRALTVVLEDVYQPHNVSAVLRTCDACGVQDVHLVESQNPLKVARDIALGSDQWLTMHRYAGEEDTSRRCLERLKHDGYRVLATSPRPPSTPLSEVGLSAKTAIVIGHETQGVSEIVLALADDRVSVPMWGFVESLNLSVAAAIALYELRQQLDASNIDWHLSEDEQDELRLLWTRLSIKGVDAVERRFEEEEE